MQIRTESKRFEMLEAVVRSLKYRGEAVLLEELTTRGKEEVDAR